MGKVKTFLKLFTRGKTVWYRGDQFTIDFVTVSGHKLYVKLVGMQDTIDAERLEIEPTLINFIRS